MALIETRSIDYVPLAERHGKVWHLWPVWFTGDAHLATLATGAISVAAGLSLFWSALAVIGGCVLGTILMAFHCTQGPHLGLPQMIQSRPQFGYLGALLVWVVALFTYIGFNALNQSLAADTVMELAGTPYGPTVVVFSLVAVAVAVIGYDLIHKAQRILAYLMLAVLAVYTVGAFGTVDFKALLAPGEFRATPFLVQFFAAAAYQLSWSIYVSDYSRYLPKEVGIRDAFFWTFWGAFVGGAWMMLVGAFAAAAFANQNIVVALRESSDAIMPGFGTIMLVTSFLGLITITSLNFYGASLTLLSVVDSVTKVTLGAKSRIAALAAVFLMAVSLSLVVSGNVLHGFEAFLGVLAYLFTPWTAINLVDFFFVRKGRYSIRAMFMADGLYGKWNWRGLVAYFVGFAAMVPFFKTGLYVGPVAEALGKADISMLIGLPVSAAVYLLLCRNLDLASELEQIEMLDRNLETEPVR
ncbi:cytosine permease [Novosphingobium sp.]|uniref:purine-cytosine permease family protein n=1 Tax=Novosphingobium sp. TaxID=1874826 RepID=UPI0025E3D676|nr:cytosine permease [Novosphingobium sp.]MCC6924426.1 cytosine permease [Novosphingobium sp.]